MNKRGLGKGLEALLPKSIDDDGIVYIEIEKIYSNRSQPRKYFNDEKLRELADSIKEHGMIQPIIVRAADNGYVIVAGERRWRAAKLAGMKEVPAIVKNVSNNEVLELALIENLQREDLNPIEEALAYKTLIEEHGMTQEDVAKKIGKSRPAIANSIRLLNLDDRVIDYLITGELTTGHARALLSLQDGDMQFDVAKKIIKDGLNVRQTENLIKRILNGEKKAIKPKEADTRYKFIQDDMEKVLGTKINIKKGKNKGKIEIEFYSDEDLQRIYEYLCNR
ncbi:chromosome segregation DNA-binding protein [Caldanaerobius fijiensis DSM 17918]|uniref:Chromosome segregation DNA-binding protein n=1 Tax=Caldanaerobius fijiensis DSM 17918 TaxID=1121256 RepID=A0A1M5AQ17_9THEO|nr:ParB/RepB/Spo0J family partition protein [Caldanaerobius fijiensis]SHF32343.1 chromosome segregation DNA-binding protein [Caldanaerobius fijiensis DSM 17918]